MSEQDSLQMPLEIPRDSIKGVPQGGDVPPQVKLECGQWYEYSASRCGLVRDCENLTQEELKAVGDKTAAAVNSGVQSICDGLGCPKKKFRNARWSQSCSNRQLCVTCTVEFMCT